MDYRNDIIQQINHLKMQERAANAKHRKGRGAGFILNYLYQNGNEVIPSELGKIMHVSTPRITTILNKLEAKDLIKRTISPEDRRNVFVSLSEQGKAVVKKRHTQQEKTIQSFIEQLGTEDTEAFIRALNVLESVIDEHGWEF